jgi:thiol-disulfide isomerase/thioredoxin
MKNNSKNRCCKNVLKSLGILLLTLVMLYSCKQEPSYTITGTVAQTELEGKQVMLGQWVEGKLNWTDTTVVAQGKYQFKGYVEKPVVGRLSINIEEREKAVHVNFIAENAKITITTDDKGRSRIAGSENNDILQKYTDTENIPREKREEIYNALRDGRKEGTLSPETEKSLSDKLNKYGEEIQTITIEFVKNNINNPAGRSRLGRLTILPLEQLKELISGANEETLKEYDVAKVVTRIQALEKTAIGKAFIDIRMPNPEGKEVALSDYAGKGKYVLIDFWASWCGPCRVEMPHVLAAYKKYKNKGFEVVGVSFDNKHDAWLKGIKDLEIPWPQMSDVKGWESEGSKLYAVSGIPHTVLLDKDGIIIAKDLRGEALDKKLAELMK